MTSTTSDFSINNKASVVIASLPTSSVLGLTASGASLANVERAKPNTSSSSQYASSATTTIASSPILLDRPTGILSPLAMSRIQGTKKASSQSPRGREEKIAPSNNKVQGSPLSSCKNNNNRTVSTPLYEPRGINAKLPRKQLNTLDYQDEQGYHVEDNIIMATDPHHLRHLVNQATLVCHHREVTSSDANETTSVSDPEDEEPPLPDHKTTDNAHSNRSQPGIVATRSYNTVEERKEHHVPDDGEQDQQDAHLLPSMTEQVQLVGSSSSSTEDGNNDEDDDFSSEDEDDWLGAVRLKDGLFVGDRTAACDADFFKANLIEYVVNCCSHQITNVFGPDDLPNDIQYLNCCLSDAAEVQRLVRGDGLDMVYEFIESASSSGSSCLIHSKTGRGRALGLVCLYLMKKYWWSARKTLEFLISRRPDIKLSQGFIDCIKWLEQRLAHEAKHSNSVPTRTTLDSSGGYEGGDGKIQNNKLSASWMDVPNSDDEHLLRNTYLNSLQSGESELGMPTSETPTTSSSPATTNSRRKKNKSTVTWIEKAEYIDEPPAPPAKSKSSSTNKGLSSNKTSPKGSKTSSKSQKSAVGGKSSPAGQKKSSSLSTSTPVSKTNSNKPSSAVVAETSVSPSTKHHHHHASTAGNIGGTVLPSTTATIMAPLTFTALAKHHDVVHSPEVYKYNIINYNHTNSIPSPYGSENNNNTNPSQILQGSQMAPSFRKVHRSPTTTFIPSLAVTSHPPSTSLNVVSETFHRHHPNAVYDATPSQSPSVSKIRDVCDYTSRLSPADMSAPPSNTVSPRSNSLSKKARLRRSPREVTRGSVAFPIHKQLAANPASIESCVPQSTTPEMHPVPRINLPVFLNQATSRTTFSPLSIDDSSHYLSSSAGTPLTLSPSRGGTVRTSSSTSPPRVQRIVRSVTSTPPTTSSDYYAMCNDFRLQNEDFSKRNIVQRSRTGESIHVASPMGLVNHHQHHATQSSLRDLGVTCASTLGSSCLTTGKGLMSSALLRSAQQQQSIYMVSPTRQPLLSPSNYRLSYPGSTGLSPVQMSAQPPPLMAINPFSSNQIQTHQQRTSDSSSQSRTKNITSIATQTQPTPPSVKSSSSTGVSTALTQSNPATSIDNSSKVRSRSSMPPFESTRRKALVPTCTQTGATDRSVNNYHQRHRGHHQTNISTFEDQDERLSQSSSMSGGMHPLSGKIIGDIGPSSSVHSRSHHHYTAVSPFPVNAIWGGTFDYHLHDSNNNHSHTNRQHS